MKGSAHIFKWGADTFIMKANWAEASSPIIVNGRQIYGNVGSFSHAPTKAARKILEEACLDDGLNVDENEEDIEESINKMVAVNTK